MTSLVTDQSATAAKSWGVSQFTPLGLAVKTEIATCECLLCVSHQRELDASALKDPLQVSLFSHIF